MSTTDFNIALGKIKEKIPLSKIAGQDVHLQKKGREFVGNCPFHHEKTGSFFVNDEKGTFYCFGCGASGDLIEYYMKQHSVNFLQAIEKLAEMAGVKLPEKQDVQSHNENILNILQKASEFFKASLLKNSAAQEYCKSRMLSKEIIDRFSIGYAPFDNISLLDFLKKFAKSRDELLKSGLFIEKDSKLLPRFKNRLMFPILNQKGWVIAFGGRGIDKNSIPKYLNSPESELFYKREALYGYNVSSKNISDKNPFVIVEGYMDVVMLHQFGFNTAIASMGTAFSSEHLAKIWKYSKEPIVCFDGDEAGYKAMLRLSDISLQHISAERSMRFALIPDKDDPDSFLKSKGKKEFQKILDASLYLIDFIWRDELLKFDQIEAKTPEHIANWKQQITKKIDLIQDAELKRLYRNDLNNRIFELLSPKRKVSSKKHAKNQQIIKSEKNLLRESILLYTLIAYPSMVPFVIENLSLVEFSEKDFEDLKFFILTHLLDSSDLSGFSSTIDAIQKTAAPYCGQFSEDNIEEIVEFWNSIFDLEFTKKNYQKEIKSAKDDCRIEIDEKKWERLKALKLTSISEDFQD